MCSVHCLECFFPSFLNQQTPVIFHGLVYMLSFLGDILHFFPSMIRDLIFCVIVPLLNYSEIGKYKCLFPLLDHELLRILNSLLSPLCPWHLIQNAI